MSGCVLFVKRVCIADPVHDEDLAPKCVVGDGGHLPGHSEGPVGGGADAPHGAALHPGAAVGRRAQRPAGRGRRQAVQGEAVAVPGDGAPLEQRVRGRGAALRRLRRQGAAARRHGRGRAPRARRALHLRLGAGARHREPLQLAHARTEPSPLHSFYNNTRFYCA